MSDHEGYDNDKKKEENQTKSNPFTGLVMQSSSINVSPPDNFDFRNADSWNLWITRFERYLSVANLMGRPDSEKVDLLCYIMGTEAEAILVRLLPHAPHHQVYQTVKDQFNYYFAPKKNVIFERFKFNARTQQPGESVDEFITDLYALAEKCEYEDLKDQLIRDRIVIGVIDKRLSERLQLTLDLTLGTAITMARQSEIQSNEARILKRDVTINKVNFKNIRGKQSSGNAMNSQRGSDDRCSKCGLRPMEERAQLRNPSVEVAKRLAIWIESARVKLYVPSTLTRAARTTKI